MRHEQIETNSGLMILLIMAVISIGGLVEIVPLFYINETVEKVDGAYLEDGLLKFKGEVVMRADELGVPGSHNVENALATIAVAKSFL